MSLPRNPTSPPDDRDSNLASTSAADEPPRSAETLRCARLSGVGRSAIGVVSLAGHGATECLMHLFRPAQNRPVLESQIRYGVWLGGAQQLQSIAGESVIVLRIAQQRYEIHCHGGPAAIDRIIDDLIAWGVIRVNSSELSACDFAAAGLDTMIDPFTRRLIDEARDVLTRCTTMATAAIALDQVRGALCRWRDDSLKRLRQEDDAAVQIADQASQMLSAGRMGIRLTKPTDVVLAGPPNVGKSSLINALVGYDRSITMDLAGTTRDVLDAETVIAGWPIRIRDTAGLHASDQAIERQGIERALQAIRSADLVIQVTEPGLQDNRRVLDAVQLHNPAALVLEVVNKSDLGAEPLANTNAIATVATTGLGIPQLMEAIIAVIRRDLGKPGDPVPINQRQLDWIRTIRDAANDPAAMLELLGGE